MEGELNMDGVQLASRFVLHLVKSLGVSHVAKGERIGPYGKISVSDASLNSNINNNKRKIRIVMGQLVCLAWLKRWCNRVLLEKKKKGVERGDNLMCI